MLPPEPTEAFALAAKSRAELEAQLSLIRRHSGHTQAWSLMSTSSGVKHAGQFGTPRSSRATMGGD